MKQSILSIEELYDQYFSYFYMKLEYVSSLGLKIYSESNKNRVTWKTKLDALNKLPLGI